MGTSQFPASAVPAPATVATDALLIQAGPPADGVEPGFGSDPAFVAALLAELKSAWPQKAVRVQAALSVNGHMLYAYIAFDQPVALGKAKAASLESTLQTAWPQLQNLRVSRLERMFASDGASVHAEPVFHYVVEMDPEAGWMPELSQWYDTEHMPGLARVPGCIRAARFLNHDDGPLSLACYDLVSEETLGSAPWLAVRRTPWSDRMRPHFTNTIRTMFRCQP